MPLILPHPGDKAVDTFADVLRRLRALERKPVSPKITTSPISGGPPANPSDGDIWIATDVNGNDGTRWQFQYNAGSSSSSKWEFIGGSPVVLQSSTSETIANGAWVLLNSGAFTIPVAGDYTFESGALGAYPTSIPNSTIEIGIGTSPSSVYGTAARSLSAPPSSFDFNLPGQPCMIAGLAVDVGVGLYGYQNGTGYTWSAKAFTVLPKRVG